MDNLHVEKEEFSLKPNQLRRNSLQPLDRHLNEIYFDQGIYINAGIDSTCGIKRINKEDLSSHGNLSS
ncbi:hypothetical protein I4U23_017268 [Adineta vaga]|nr:hypothetical protein I4U23_017268 [Adineta vaga]